MDAIKIQRFLAWLSASKGLMQLLFCWLAGKLRKRQVICIAMTEHMGDIFAAEPISRRVKSLAAGPAYIVWVTAHRYAEIPQMFVAVDQVITVRNLGAWVHLKRFLSFLQVYDLHLDKRWCAQTNLTLQNPTANPAIDDRNYYNHVNLLGLQCSNAGLEIFDDQPQLELVDDAATGFKGSLHRPYIVIHARSNEMDREWSDEKWRQLIRILHAETGHPIVEVGTERPVISGDTNAEVSLVGQQTITELCALIRGCSLFIGVDSGPAHIANAFQVNSMVLIGWYRIFRNYVPYSGWLARTADISVLHYDGPLSDLPVEAAIQRALKLLGGKYCSAGASLG